MFKDGQGGDVFVALTMVKKNDETGMPASYALQFISRGATSWAAEGDVLYLGGDAALAEAANSPEGARLEVLYHDGLFDVWVNYSKVATNIKAIADSRAGAGGGRRGHGGPPELEQQDHVLPGDDGEGAPRQRGLGSHRAGGRYGEIPNDRYKRRRSGGARRARRYMCPPA